jgi:hypothetical protein
VNEHRRVVSCVASAAVLVVVAAGMNRLLASPPDGGWFMYTPDTEPVFSTASSSDARVLREGAVWLGAVALWFSISWWLFRKRD